MKFYKDKEFVRHITRLAVPIALQNLLTSVVNIVDQVMVGALPAEIANYAMSAVLLVNQIVFIFQIVIFAICNTNNVFISQYWGKNDRDAIPPAVGFGLCLSIVIALLTTLVCMLFPHFVVGLFAPKAEILRYAEEFLRVVALSFLPSTISIVLTFALRGLKQMKLALISNGAAIVVNCFLNFSLMFGKFGFPEMGLVGAAWGTAFSRIVEMVIVLVGLLIAKYPITARLPKMVTWSKDYLKKFSKMFLPILSNEVFWVLGASIYLAVFAQLPDSENVLAAVNVTQSVDKLVGVAMIGLGSATSVVIGNILGMNDVEKAKAYAKMSVQYSLVVGILIAAIMFALSFCVQFFFVNLNAESLAYARNLMMIFAVAAIVRTLTFNLMIGVLRAGGDTTFCFITETCTVWLIAVPICCLTGLLFQWRVEIIYSLIYVEEALKSLILYLRQRSGKWIRVLVGKDTPAVEQASAQGIEAEPEQESDPS